MTNDELRPGDPDELADGPKNDPIPPEDEPTDVEPPEEAG